jgi:hypothetical protein
MSTTASSLAIFDIESDYQENGNLTMGAKRSAEMKLALRLVSQGVPYKEAATISGVHWKSLYVLMPRRSNGRRVKRNATA